jgi:hypothetical protein
MKKPQDLIQLALLGMAAASLTTLQPLDAQTVRGQETPGYSYSQAATFNNDLTPDQQQFYGMLNPDAQVMFTRLTSEQRDLAINVYNAPIGQNLCAGLNACSEPASGCHSVNGCHTPGNSCMGHGPGPNTSPKRFTNPNDAVRVVYNKMAAQRADM